MDNQNLCILHYIPPTTKRVLEEFNERAKKLKDGADKRTLPKPILPSFIMEPYRTTIVARRDNDTVRIAWAHTAWGDNFERREGRVKAIGRLDSNKVLTVPFVEYKPQAVQEGIPNTPEQIERRSLYKAITDAIPALMQRFEDDKMNHLRRKYGFLAKDVVDIFNKTPLTFHGPAFPVSKAE